MTKKYNIDTRQRQYLQKKNMAEIFSQIFVPEMSLRKIYSALYSYYFQGNKSNRLINKAEFLDSYEYRLDKPGIFFLSEDILFEDVFYDLVGLMEEALQGNVDIIKDHLPQRFYSAYLYWSHYDKKEIDVRKEEYYISSPSIVFDGINEVINLHLSTQKTVYIVMKNVDGMYT